MTTIKEVAERTMQSCGPHEKLQDAYLRFAQRFLAAYLAEQGPRGWWNPSYPSLSVQLTKPYDGGGWEPFFTAPPLPEPAHSDHPMRHYDRTCPACNEGATPSSEEVREMVERLRSPTEPYGYQSQLACEAADLIERLAAGEKK